MTTRTKEDLEAAVNSARNALAFAEKELLEFERSPNNFRFDNLDDAFELEWELRDRASEDCEGSYNVGDDEYRQEFYIDDKKYTAVLFNIEYNRHDKRYYYVDYAKFRIEDEDGIIHTP
jgi:hypothetical protein